MSVTEDTSQSRGWLKFVACLNISVMSVTEAVFQLRGWLKEEAPWNIWYMSVTEETSQEDMSPLKEAAL